MIFELARLLRDAERSVTRSCELVPVTLDPELAHAEGTLRGAPVVLETRAWTGATGSPIAWPRFATMEGGGLDVGNVVVVSRSSFPLPILGADLVALGPRMLDGETSWQFLRDVKADERTKDIPTLVVTVTNREEKARALVADEFHVKPLDREWLTTKIKALARVSAVERVLVIDDDQVARYLVRKHLDGLPYEVLEASNGMDGIRMARERRPNVIFLDFVMPEMSAFDVLDELKKDPLTRGIPVIIHTSKKLADDERTRLEAEATAILQKQSLSREVAIGRIREALEKAGIRGTHGVNA